MKETTMMNKNLIYVALMASSIACAEKDHNSSPEQNATVQESIINGTVPAPGGLVQYGVVNVPGCTGTLLTNRHVLTAHHCVRQYDDTKGTWAAAQNTGMSAFLEDGNGNQTQNESRIFEPPQPWSVNAGDYSIIELATPMTISGQTDGFFNPIYSQADSSLVNKSVLCIGYGMTQEATPTTPGGGFKLTYATMTINSVVSNQTYQINRTASNVVGAGGDSGSSCFLNGFVTGVQSTCGLGSYYDLNHNGVDDVWGENYNIPSCTGASAGSLRSWVNQQILANTTVGYSFVPALSPGTSVYANVAAVNQTSNNVLVSTNTTLPAFAARSGRLDVSVPNQPPNMMCPKLHTDTALNGDMVLTGTCLGNGLVSALIATI
jgi:V8-like Glu-specific endopeptidase